MKTEKNKRAANYVPFEVEEKMIEREWEGIRRGLERRRTTGKYRVAGLAVAAVLALTVTAYVFVDFEGSEAGVQIKEQSGNLKSLTLPDGSKLQMDRLAEIEMGETSKEEVFIAVSKGRVLFDVPTDEQRKFEVSAGNALVVVKGTRFSVEVSSKIDRSIVKVSVMEGSVEVRDLEKGSSVALNSGRTWSSTFDPGAELKEPEEVAILEEEDETELQQSESDEESEPPRDGKNVKGDRSATQPQTVGPGELFKNAQQENRKGNSALAADLFNELVTKYKSDSRAPLAAFQLGRLRMDVLGDSRGALKAFNTAIRLGPGYPFIEDVEARRVEAFERLGRTKECIQAKKKYLTRYPGGVHVGSVERRCVD